MAGKSRYWLIVVCVGLIAYLFLARLLSGDRPAQEAKAQQACQAISSPSQIQAPTLITFDDLANNAVIGDHYQPGYGVRFDFNTNPQAIAFTDTPANVHTPPNVAFFNPTPPVTSTGIPLIINFDKPKNFVGMYVGNGDGRTVATLSGLNVAGGIVCRAVYQGVGDPVNIFLGFYDPDGSIVTVRLDYGDTSLSETIDDLFFSPAGAAPTRTPMPTWTPVPTLSPTAGPPPTPTPVVPIFAYLPFNPSLILPVLQTDLSILGIEITQGVQCFNTSQGLASCPDNSMTMVNKKDATARIYLRATGSTVPMNNVPVRLHIQANNVWYTADALGKATASINQANRDDAEIYFNVNFNSNVIVDFYAEVDPNHVIAETNENNNCYPTLSCSSPYLTRTFQNGVTKKIVGYRLHYHPTGYGGTQNAAGWAVNGGGADWLEQVLPMRNNGIDYSLRSGYLDWTTSLSTGTGQHALIQNLNTLWTLENIFSFWFTGAFTGARHVYGWAPSAGYSGGHADMPIYPHAGGLGVVGIGSDAPGTNTDNPGSGALIFAHELVHDYNAYHTNTIDACGSNDSNSDFPYSSSSIQEFGFNPFTGKIYNPNNTHDLMSYCPSGGSRLGWIAPFTWNKMFSLLPTGASPMRQVNPTLAETIEPTASQESLVVNVTVYNPANQPPSPVPGKLNDMHRVGTGVSLCPPDGGPYALELRDAFDNPLYSCSFNVNFESEYDPEAPAGPNAPNEPPPFPPEDTLQEDIMLVVPWELGTSQVVLTFQPIGNQPNVVLDTKKVSDNPPVVTITSPAGSESWAAGSTHTLQWTGFDADGDPLTYALFYSYDSGATWELVQDGLNVTQYDVQTDAMKGGSDVRFRVEATDGINTGFDETNESITIPNHAPNVFLLNPTADQVVPPGGLVVLQGSANDFEDGTLPDESLAWTDNVQGGLGIGPSVALNTLTPGKHIITLTASDSLNISTSQSVTIHIGYSVYLPLTGR